MFDVGDKVVYPMHGAGIIEDIETKIILGKSREYYVMKIPFGNMKVMIPVDNSENIGMRSIVSDEMISAVLYRLGEPVDEMPENWNKRYRENMNKLKSGELFNVADVIRYLLHSEKNKGLSAGEKKMLTNAKQILISEILLIRDIDIEAAEQLIEAAVFNKKVKGLDNV